MLDLPTHSYQFPPGDTRISPMLLICARHHWLRLPQPTLQPGEAEQASKPIMLGAGLPQGVPDADLLNLYSGIAGLTASLAQLVHSGSAQACGLAQLMTHETRQCVPSLVHPRARVVGSTISPRLVV